MKIQSLYGSLIKGGFDYKVAIGKAVRLRESVKGALTLDGIGVCVTGWGPFFTPLLKFIVVVIIIVIIVIIQLRTSKLIFHNLS